MTPHNKKIGNNEIALAMELLTEGVKLKLIANEFGVQAGTLQVALCKARKVGMQHSENGRI